MNDYPVGEGWHDLIDPIAEKAKGEGVEVFGVKERFGSLRVVLKTWNEASDELKQMIAEAEAESRKTCEECGNLGGRVDVGGWIKTLCDDCRTKLEKDLP